MARPCPGCSGRDCTTVPCRIKRRLWDVLVSWEGTPYMDGQACKGVAADCRGFMIRVFDELFGVTEPLPRPAAKDLGRHDPQAAAAEVLRYLKRWPFERDETGRPVEIELSNVKPGDVILMKSGRGEREGHGHVMIVGLRPRTAWHASHKGGFVGETGLSAAAEALGIWRPANQERWLEVADERTAG